MTKRKKSEAKKAPPADASARARRPGIPQAHGGMLVPGAGAGAQPGAGRPPSQLRARLRDAAADRVQVLEEIADGTLKIPLVGVCEYCGKTSSVERMGLPEILKAATSAADRRASVETMLRFGIGMNDEISVVSADVMSRLEAQAARFVAELPPEVLAIVKRITDEVWQ